MLNSYGSRAQNQVVLSGGGDTRLGKWQCMWHGKSQFTVVKIANLRFLIKWPDRSLHKHNQMILHVFLKKKGQKWLHRKQSALSRWQWSDLPLWHCMTLTFIQPLSWWTWWKSTHRIGPLGPETLPPLCFPLCPLRNIPRMFFCKVNGLCWMITWLSSLWCGKLPL